MITKEILTSNFVSYVSTGSYILVGGSQGKQRQCLQVFRHLYAVVVTPKYREVVILIKHSDPHCGFGVVRRQASIFRINCPDT